MCTSLPWVTATAVSIASCRAPGHLMVGKGEGGEVTFRAQKHDEDLGLDMKTAHTTLSKLPAEGRRLPRVNSYTGARSQDSLRQV